MKLELINNGKGIYGQGGTQITAEDLYILSTDGASSLIDLQFVAQEGNITDRTLVHAPATSNSESATLGQVLSLVSQGQFIRYDISNQNLNVTQRNSALNNLGIRNISNGSWRFNSDSVANGEGSAVFGKGNIANSKNSFIIGEYAEDLPYLPEVYDDELDEFFENPENTILQVGVGNQDLRIDALRILRSGFSVFSNRIQHLPAVESNQSATLGQVQGLINNINVLGQTDPRYIRKDVNDNNGSNTLTLGVLNVTGTTSLNGSVINLPNIPTENSNVIDVLMVDTAGRVRKFAYDLLRWNVANANGDTQFSIRMDERLRFAGAGDTSVSFNPSNRTVTISSTGGSSGGAGVVTFNGRDGAVVSQTGDYNTSQVTEVSNLYFTPERVRATNMGGTNVTNVAITGTDTIVAALGKLQGQINNRVITTRTLGFSGVSGLISVNGVSGTTQTSTLEANRTWSIGLVPTAVGAGSYRTVTVDTYGRVTAGSNPTTLAGHGITNGVVNTTSVTAGNGLTGGGALSASRTITLGTPSTLTVSTSNSVTAGSHTHAIDLSGRTIATGTGLTGGGNLGANRTLSITDIAAGSGTVGALRYNGTTNSAGRMYGGTSNPSSTTRLNYAGNLWVTNLHTTQDAVFFTSSDERLKDNLKVIDNALEKVAKLSGYQFDWNKNQELYKGKDYGVVAQEVKELFPEIVSERINGYLGVKYERLIPVLIEAVKELKRKLEDK